MKNGILTFLLLMVLLAAVLLPVEAVLPSAQAAHLRAGALFMLLTAGIGLAYAWLRRLL